MTNWNKIWKDKKYPMWINKGDIANYWDKNAAKRFHRLSKNRSSSEKQVEELNLKRTDVVLDIGCGTGRFTIPIAKRVKTVYGIDVSKEMLKFAKRESEKEGLKNISLINANFETFDINKIEKVDVSISYNSLGVYDIKKVLTKINNLTKRDVFIFTFAEKGEWLDKRLAEIVYGEHIKDIPPSAEIIYNLLKEMGIEPDFEVRHNVWKSEYNSMEDAVKKITEFYKLGDGLKKKVENFVKENSVYNGEKYVLSQQRDIAKIHWRVK